MLSAGLPNITGTFTTDSVKVGTTYQDMFWGRSGAFYGISLQSSLNYLVTNGIGATDTSSKTGLDASKSNAIYGNSATVQPPSVTANFLIKY